MGVVDNCCHQISKESKAASSKWSLDCSLALAGGGVVGPTWREDEAPIHNGKTLPGRTAAAAVEVAAAE